MSGPELDPRPEFDSGLPGLNLGHRFEVDPTWIFPQCISEIPELIGVNLGRGSNWGLKNFITPLWKHVFLTRIHVSEID